MRDKKQTPPLLTAGLKRKTYPIGIDPKSIGQRAFRLGKTEIMSGESKLLIHELGLTGPAAHFQAVRDSLEKAYPMLGPLKVVGGRKHYEAVWGFEDCGFVFLSESRRDSGRWRLEVKGQGCDALDLLDLTDLMVTLSTLADRVTRIDVARDVRGWPEFMGHVVNARKKRHYRGVDLSDKIIFNDVAGVDHPGTVPFGSLKSDRYVRCYDKGIETGTLPPGRWIRWEVQLRDEFACKAFASIVDAARSSPIVDGVRCELQEVLHQITLGVVSFTTAPRGESASKGKVPKWWTEFCESRPPLRFVADPRRYELPVWLQSFTPQLRVIKAAADAEGVEWADALGLLLAEDLQATDHTLAHPLYEPLRAAVRGFSRRAPLSGRVGLNRASREVLAGRSFSSSVRP